MLKDDAHMKKTTFLLIQILIASALLANTSHAARPSLNKLNTEVNKLNEEIQAMKDANCNQAEVMGDTYRPQYCEPACGCFYSEDQPAVKDATSCVEDPIGDFTITYSTLESNACSEIPDTDISICSAEIVICSSDIQCSDGYSCSPVSTAPVSICLPPASTCSTDTDCPYYEKDNFYTISNVGSVNSPEPARCDGRNIINSNDANACLELVENVSGVDCGN
jgi:hypothetical protein